MSVPLQYHIPIISFSVLVPPQCPASHATAIAGGAECCDVADRMNDAMLDASCDGAPFLLSDPATCCPDPMPCPTDPWGLNCINAAGKNTLYTDLCPMCCRLTC